MLGLKEYGIADTIDQHKALITPAMKGPVDKVSADIASGKLEVHDGMSDNKCPM